MGDPEDRALAAGEGIVEMLLALDLKQTLDGVFVAIELLHEAIVSVPAHPFRLWRKVTSLVFILA